MLYYTSQSESARAGDASEEEASQPTPLVANIPEGANSDSRTLYAFILGRVYTLSLAEVIQVLGTLAVDFRVKTVAPEIALIETTEKLKIGALQDRLGGTIKIVEIIETLNHPQKKKRKKQKNKKVNKKRILIIN